MYYSAKRTQVIDDESDYFSTDSNQWLKPSERDALRHKQQEVHAQRHASRRDRYRITFDFAGRRVMEETEAVDSHAALSETTGDDGEVQQTDYNPDDFYEDLVNPNLRVSPPKVGRFK